MFSYVIEVSVQNPSGRFCCLNYYFDSKCVAKTAKKRAPL